MILKNGLYDIEKGTMYLPHPYGFSFKKRKPYFETETGFVYLFHMTETNFYKIGKSQNPEERVKTLATLPTVVVITHQIPTNYMSRLENQLHWRFAHRRKNGEWFALDNDDVNYITQLERVDYDPEVWLIPND